MRRNAWRCFFRQSVGTNAGAYERVPEQRLSLVLFDCQRAERDNPRSRDAIAPEVWPNTLVRIEGAGKAGCPLHPQPRVRNNKAHERSHHRFTGFTRPSLRNGFNGFLRALPGDRALLPPSLADYSANLTPASGRQDHTTSPSAPTPLVLRRYRVHCIPPQRS